MATAMYYYEDVLLHDRKGKKKKIVVWHPMEGKWKLMSYKFQKKKKTRFFFQLNLEFTKN